MTDQPPTAQSGQATRFQVHALERVHSHGFERLRSVNLAGATGLFVRLTDPDSGVSIDLAEGAIDDAPGGLFGADAIPNEIVTLGNWKMQGRFTLGGSERNTFVGVVEVRENLPAPP